MPIMPHLVGKNQAIRHYWDVPDFEFEFVPSCDAGEENAIRLAFNKIQNVIIPEVNALGGECRTLAGCLRGKALSTLNITCEDCELDGYVPELGSNFVNICYRVLPPRSTLAQLTATLFHELVHTCGGNDVDAYHLTHALFWQDGAETEPSVKGFEDMCKCENWHGHRVGKFVSWYPDTGASWIRMRVSPGGYSQWGDGWTVAGTLLQPSATWSYTC